MKEIPRKLCSFYDFFGLDTLPGRLPAKVDLQIEYSVHGNRLGFGLCAEGRQSSAEANGG